MNTKNSKLPNIVAILVLTVLTSLMWISFSVYRALTTKPAPVVPQAVTQPLTPTLDTTTINKVESSLFLDSSQIPQNVVTTASSIPAATKGPIATLAPSPTASSEATPTPTATP